MKFLTSAGLKHSSNLELACVLTTSACLQHARLGNLVHLTQVHASETGKLACSPQAHAGNTLETGWLACSSQARFEALSKTGASLVHSPQARDRSHASSSLSSPKQQDTLKSATILFSGGSGRRDDTRNQNCAQDLYPSLGWRHHCQCTNLVQAGSQDCLEACSVLGSAPSCGAQNLYPERFCCLEQQCIPDASGTDTGTCPTVLCCTRSKWSTVSCKI